MALALIIAMLIVAHAAGTFTGLLACAYFDFGFAFDDLRRDAAKCVGLAVIVILLICGIFWVATGGYVLVLVVALVPATMCGLLVWLWPDAEAPAISVAFLSSMVTTSAVAGFFASHM